MVVAALTEEAVVHDAVDIELVKERVSILGKKKERSTRGVDGKVLLHE